MSFPAILAATAQSAVKFLPPSQGSPGNPPHNPQFSADYSMSKSGTDLAIYMAKTKKVDKNDPEKQ